MATFVSISSGQVVIWGETERWPISALGSLRVPEESLTLSVLTHKKELLWRFTNECLLHGAWERAPYMLCRRWSRGATLSCFHLLTPPQEMQLCCMAESAAQNSLTPEASYWSRLLHSRVHEVARRKEDYMLSPCWKKYLQTRYNWGGPRDIRNSPTQENDTSPLRKMPDSNGNRH